MPVLAIRQGQHTRCDANLTPISHERRHRDVFINQYEKRPDRIYKSLDLLIDHSDGNDDHAIDQRSMPENTSQQIAKQSTTWQFFFLFFFLRTVPTLMQQSADVTVYPSTIITYC